MTPQYSKYIRFIHFTGDIALINISFVGAYLYKFGVIDYELLHGQYLSLLLFFNLAWIIAAFSSKIYALNRVMHFDQIVRIVFKGIFVHLMFVAAFVVLRKAHYYSREHFLLFYASFGVLLFSWRFVMNMTLKSYRKSGHNFRRVVIVGLGNASLELSQFFNKHPEWGYKFEGFFDNETNHESDMLKGSIDELANFVIDHNIDEIYCSLEDLTKAEVKQIIEFADNNFIRLKILPDYGGFMYRKVNIDFYDNMPVMSFRKMPLDEMVNRIIKRSFDMVVSSLVILFILSWLFPIIALLVRISSKGPVFFKQKRSGKNNSDFWCYKFRSMYVNHDADKLQAKRGDSRITPIGAFIRKTSIDEFPQFINVLYGDMSIVGPRPHMVKHTEEYAQVIEKYMVRHFVKPGITGLAQAKGFRGETSDSQMMKNRVRLDLIYIENWTLWFDVKIILLTIKAAFKGDAY
jgi:putative colanic acid biosynthesis UDP-glucose lipid carrier transferase